MLRCMSWTVAQKCCHFSLFFFFFLFFLLEKEKKNPSTVAENRKLFCMRAFQMFGIHSRDIVFYERWKSIRILDLESLKLTKYRCDRNSIEMKMLWNGYCCEQFAHTKRSKGKTSSTNIKYTLETKKKHTSAKVTSCAFMAAASRCLSELRTHTRIFKFSQMQHFTLSECVPFS